MIGEDVLSAQPQIDAKVHLVGPERDVEAVRHRERKRHQGRSPAMEPAWPWAGEAQGLTAGFQGRVDGCHGSSRGCWASTP